jgi:hypothetical protein
MSFFTPFAFIKQEVAAGGRTDIPPFDPYAFYDATNTSYSSASVWNDVVSYGADNFALKPRNGTATYTSGEYYTFSQASSTNFELTGSTALSDFMNNMASFEHTRIALIYPTSTTEEDFFGGGDTITMIDGGSLRGYVLNANTPSAITTTVSGVTTNVYRFGGQRMVTPTISSAYVSAISGLVSSLPATINNSSTLTWGAEAAGDTRFIIGSRNEPVRAYFDGRIAQAVVYDKALTDGEIQDVLIWMKNHQGL